MLAVALGLTSTLVGVVLLIAMARAARRATARLDGSADELRRAREAIGAVAGAAADLAARTRDHR